MLIIADENIPEVKAAFSGFGEVKLLTGRDIQPADVSQADILLVRSVTPVNQALLSGSKVCFVGSATIGTNHVDIDWLEEQGIKFSSAPGCNAVSAAEYVLSALLTLAEEQQLSLAQMTMGIIGCGNVGSRVQSRAEALGIDCLVCDPPRAEQEGSAQFVDLDEAMQADVVTIHVPFTKSGRYPTDHLIGPKHLDLCSDNAILINTSRGGVVDERALHAKLDACPDFKVVLDVWAGEPQIDVDLLDKISIATPHIAGYSRDGKIRATRMLYQSLCNFLGEKPEALKCFDLAAPVQSLITATSTSHASVIGDCLKYVYPIRQDDQALRELSGLADGERASGFDALRKNYWPRRECSAYQVGADNLPANSLKTLSAYGFTVT